jgi:hypothetical protein
MSAATYFYINIHIWLYISQNIFNLSSTYLSNYLFIHTHIWPSAWSTIYTKLHVSSCWYLNQHPSSQFSLPSTLSYFAYNHPFQQWETWLPLAFIYLVIFRHCYILYKFQKLLNHTLIENFTNENIVLILSDFYL